MSNPEAPIEEQPAAESEKEEKPHGRLHGWRLTIAAGIFLAIVIANVLIQLPYFVLSPGDTIPVKQFVSVPPEHEYKAKGEVLLTTVSLLRAHPFDIAWAWVTPGAQIEKKKEILGTQTPKQFNVEAAQQMDGSQMAAIYVAMQRAGKDVTLVGEGATIRAVKDGVPAQGKVNAGDTIVKVDGKSVTLASDVGDVVRGHKPGEDVTLDLVDTAGKTRTVTVATAALPTDPKVAYIGVSVETKNLHLNTAFPVSFKTTDIGGPSAGLAFTLALLDDLTPGDLVGSGKIAATGTMDGEGNVGEIGGIEQKTRSVRKSGASLFIVPSAEAAEAKKYAGKKLKVVGVDTLDQAVDALKANGGDASGLHANTQLKPAA